MKPDVDTIALDTLICRTTDEVATKNGISVSALYRIRQGADFAEAVKRHKANLFRDAMNTAQASASDAVQTLRAIAADATAPASARVSAAGKLLDVGLSIYDQEEIIDRLISIERRIGDAKGYAQLPVSPRADQGLGIASYD